MNILLDTRWLREKPTGVGNYIYELLKVFAEQDEVQFTLFGNNGNLSSKMFTHLPLSDTKRKLYQGLWKTIKRPHLNRLVKEHDLVHFTNATAIPNHYRHNIVTVHDLAYLDYPEMIEPKNLKFLQKNIPWSLEKASTIIAVSEATKIDIIDHLGIRPEKIKVIYNGLDPNFLLKLDHNELTEIQQKYHLPEKFLFSVNTIEPRKDFSTLIMAYGLLPEEIQQEYPLIIVGNKGWRDEYEKIIELIKDLGLGDYIRFLGYIENVDLPGIYQLASIYLHTSVKEGFGIGLIQAMASGIPLVASKISCHPEIVEDAGCYFEAKNPSDLAKTLQKVLSDGKLQETLINNAARVIKKYSWQKAAAQTLELYKGFNPL